MEASDNDKLFSRDDGDEVNVAKKARVATVRTVDAGTRGRANLGPDRRRGGAAAHGGSGHGQVAAATTTTATRGDVPTDTKTNRHGTTAATTTAAAHGTGGASASRGNDRHGKASNTTTTTTTAVTTRPGTRRTEDEVEDEFLEALAAQEAADNAAVATRRMDMDESDDEEDDDEWDDESEEAVDAWYDDDSDDFSISDTPVGFIFRAIELLNLPRNMLQEGVNPEASRYCVAKELGLEHTSERSPHAESLSELPERYFNAREVDRAMARRIMAAMFGFQLPPGERSVSGEPNGGHGVGNSSPRTHSGGGGGGGRSGGSGNLGNPPGPGQGCGGPHGGGNVGPQGGGNFGPQGGANVPRPPPGKRYHVYDDEGNCLYSINENGVVAPQDGTTSGSLA
jgi:uncharacterized membrane protein YgcG